MNVYDKIAENFTRASREVSLAKLTTFKIGGNCRLLIEACDTSEISKTLALCRRYDVKYYILGNGSDILAADEGFDGVVLKLGVRHAQVRASGDKILAQSGASGKSVYKCALAKGLCGAEFLATLPASVGGAVCMNAGCFGTDMSDIVDKVWATDGNEEREFTGRELAFGYRNSAFSDNGFVVTAASLSLEKAPREFISARAAEFMTAKRLGQPLESPSAGSVFRRDGDIIPARLIDRCRLKGYRVGDAAVSEKHAGFIVNKGHATARDVARLIDIVGTRVKAEFGVNLQLEIKLLGSTDDFRRLSYAYGVQPRQKQD